MEAPRLFHIMLFFCHPKLVKKDFFQPREYLLIPLDNVQAMKPYILIKVNPNILREGLKNKNVHVP